MPDATAPTRGARRVGGVGIAEEALSLEARLQDALDPAAAQEVAVRALMVRQLLPDEVARPEPGETQDEAAIRRLLDAEPNPPEPEEAAAWLRDHRAIFAACRPGEAVAARRTLDDHLDRAGRLVLARLSRPTMHRTIPETSDLGDRYCRHRHRRGSGPAGSGVSRDRAHIPTAAKPRIAAAPPYPPAASKGSPR